MALSCIFHWVVNELHYHSRSSLAPHNDHGISLIQDEPDTSPKKKKKACFFFFFLYVNEHVPILMRNTCVTLRGLYKFRHRIMCDCDRYSLFTSILR